MASIARATSSHAPARNAAAIWRRTEASSARATATAALIAVNMAAISQELFESELFGREKGAYTGALSREIGRFELAHQGKQGRAARYQGNRSLFLLLAACVVLAGSTVSR